MFTGILKRFLKISAAVAVGASVLLVLPNAQAAKPAGNLTITEASWDGNDLRIRGSGAGNILVEASNAASPFQELGSDTPGNNGRYDITNSDPSSSTVCSVHVEQFAGGELKIAEAPVTGNSYCDGPQNLPPICAIDTPANDVTINEGESVNFTGTATDPDGVVQGFSWDFDGDGNVDSTAEDPGLVAYPTAGSYTAIFDATDDSGDSCSPVATRTITVQGDIIPPPPLADQTKFKMMMNYELGMHCTGFEFAYCCVLPAYNSILTQVVKPQNGINTPQLLEADPNNNVASILDGSTGDVLGRHTVMRDYELDGDGNFKKYVLRYWHDAQPRSEGNGKEQTSTLISNVEGNSLLAWNTVADAADLNTDGTFKLSDPSSSATDYNGVRNAVLGNGSYEDTDVMFTGMGVNTPIDNYQNVVWNHLYIYSDTEGNFTCTAPVSREGDHCYALADDPDALCDSELGAGDGVCGVNSTDANKLRLGLHVGYPTNFGPAGHNMEGLLTFSGDTGTVVFTQMKVLENLPVMLTSPRIWEALGLPLTPFEDSIDFFGDPGLVNEDSIRPFVAMKARLHEAICDESTGVCTEGPAVLDQGNEIVGFGTAPIDIPNCERCHSAFDTQNSPNVTGTGEAALVQQEINFWNAYYSIDTNGGDSDWYSRLKGAAISMISRHDTEHGTSFLANYDGISALRPATCERGLVGNACSLHSECDTVPGGGDGQCDIPQNTRTGHESVICQKCHADNVIAVVKSANCGPNSNCDLTAADELMSNIAGHDPITGDGHLISPLTEALHWNHRESSECVDPNDPATCGTITMTDAAGRSGGCQGCHPAHRSDGDMAGYPIDLDGDNFYAALDNRDANGGCFVGRDVHSNPVKDIDGAETPSHLNAVGQWLQANVANDSGSWKGIWCTNCHNQATQQMWKAENVADLVNAQPTDPGHVREPLANATLFDVVEAVNDALGTTTSLAQFESWLDPRDPAGEGAAILPSGADRVANDNSAIWTPDPGMCNHAASLLGLGEASPYQDGNVASIEIAIGSEDGTECSTGIGLPGPDCGTDPGNPSFYICGSLDGDLDVSVSLRAGGIRASDGTYCKPDPADKDCVAQSPFCTTSDCVEAAKFVLAQDGYTGSTVVPVPMSAATDGRDHWLSPGEPHCADCHAAPYVEQSGNINPFPPFNYPRKASLMRYSRGHQDITCQGCHESIHGLYPVTSDIDTTSYAQAAALNHDGSHGPLKCGTCHDVDNSGIPTWVQDLEYNGQPIGNDYDAAVSWMHTYTLEASPLAAGGVCENCHGVKGNNWDLMENGGAEANKKWIQHGYRGRVSRAAMDKVEMETQGYLSGAGAIAPEDGVCQECHRDRTNKITCASTRWKDHLIEARVAESVYEDVSTRFAGSTCGW